MLERVLPALDRALGKVDDYLFDRSQQGDEEFGLMALRDLRRQRGQISRRYDDVVQTGFRNLRNASEWFPVDGRKSDLSLLSEQDLEEQLAVEQLADSLVRLHGPSVEMASKRIAHVAGREDLQAQDNPLAPAFLSAALRAALAESELVAGVRIVVFKFFERELGAVLGAAYERANTLMIAAGVLPELRATVKVSAQAHAPAGPQDQQAPTPSHGQVQLPAQVNAVDQAMFGNLLGLLQGWRTAMGGNQADAEGGQAQPGAQQAPVTKLGSSELMSILSLMQQDMPNTPLPPREAGGNHRTLADQLRQEVAQNARKLGVAGDNLHLDGLDEDAVDLVALLFDVLLDGPQFDANIRRKIGRMLVPYVKVAVKDRRMFLFKEHPARRLLNTVAEACEGNHGDAPQEQALLNRVDYTIDRLVAEFNEDVAIFETLEQELRSYMAQHRKRFELAEKRATEAQRGRERLDLARSAVAAELMQHRGERELPPVMDEFIGRHVSHHLTQVMLRDGHGSPRHEQAIQAVDRLLLAFDYAEVRSPLEELPTLPRAQFEAILSSSGCTGDTAQLAIDSLQDALIRLTAGERAADNPNHMPEQVILPEPKAVEPEPQLEVVAGNDHLDYEGTMLDRMRKLQVGSWLQLATSADRVEPAKVSWISPISSRLLLVNRRGIRVLVASAEELAAMAKLGKVSLREGDSVFDNAMHQVADRLKNAASQL
ncbi:hypothetical protein GCM10010080_01160 [Thermomonas carbonis]|uniref:DUF1631 family protein n=2 Tax=Thermomonas carbonis TaxID=1463158 RepID=A0A7G9SNY2_9GAMM|nr:DUF1631 family protein [Thermomonas carbonis]GHB93887.1 hypothetical protein GCM10010080_01160 [Thermomonas carbonis]